MFDNKYIPKVETSRMATAPGKYTNFASKASKPQVALDEVLKSIPSEKAAWIVLSICGY